MGVDSPSAHPEELDLLTVNVILPALPVMLPVPLNGMGAGHGEEPAAVEPLPETVLDPTSVPLPVPVTEPVAA